MFRPIDVSRYTPWKKTPSAVNAMTAETAAQRGSSGAMIRPWVIAFRASPPTAESPAVSRARIAIPYVVTVRKTRGASGSFTVA